MKKTIIIAAVMGVCAMTALVGAQVFLQPISLLDFKASGTKLGWFHQNPAPRYINFKHGAALSGGNLNVLPDYNADGGFAVEPGGVAVGKTATRPTCALALRGVLWTTFGTNTPDGGVGDGGTKDLTYQCCRAKDNTYSWLAQGCN